MADSYAQFKTRYEDMADEELLQLAEQSDDLVPDAQAALQDELESRQLTAEVEERKAPPPPNEPQFAYESALLADPRRLRAAAPQAPEAGLALVHSTESIDEASEIQRRLTDNGILSQLQVLILVPPEEADKAYKLLEDLPGLNLSADPDEEDSDE